MGAQAGQWPGLDPRMALVKGWARLKWSEGRFGSKNDEKVKVLRMSLPIAENLSGLQGVFLAYLEAPNSILVKKLKKCRILLNYPPFNLPLLAHVGPMAVWDPLG